VSQSENRAAVILSLSAKDLLFFRSRVELALIFRNHESKSRFFVAPLLRMTCDTTSARGRKEVGVATAEFGLN
jgi:hypothetical protein